MGTVTVPYGDDPESTAKALIAAAGDTPEAVRTGRDGFVISAELAAAAGIGGADGDAEPQTAGTTTTAPHGGDQQFDPSGHTITDVLAYLRTAENAERDRVLGAERAGKARRRVVEFKPADEQEGQR